MAMVRQDGTPPFNHRGTRIGSRSVDVGDLARQWPMRPQRPAPGVADQEARYNSFVWDTGIKRDNTPWYPIPHYTPAGKGVANWSECGPPRPELSQRNVTVHRRRGTDATRHLLDPRTGTTGLTSQGPITGQGAVRGVHTSNPQHTAATIGRYGEATNPAMKVRRQNRLAPARYDGQSYSQTTQIQGGSR